MGADLYIHEIFKPNYNRRCEEYIKLEEERKRLSAQDEVDEAAVKQIDKEIHKVYDAMYSEGYFRDSYNPSSVMWCMKLSWWRDVLPLLDDSGRLVGENIHKLIDMINSAGFCVPSTIEDLNVMNLSTDGEDPVGEWNDYYKAKREKLLNFLKAATELGLPVHCSL